MSIIDDIRQKLSLSLKPQHISVLDSSASHYGHDGASEGTISHVAIRIVSDIFEGKSRLDRQRLAYNAIANEISQIHAITELVTRTPAEEQERIERKTV